MLHNRPNDVASFSEMIDQYANAAKDIATKAAQATGASNITAMVAQVVRNVREKLSGLSPSGDAAAQDSPSMFNSAIEGFKSGLAKIMDNTGTVDFWVKRFRENIISAYDAFSSTGPSLKPGDYVEIINIRDGKPYAKGYIIKKLDELKYSVLIMESTTDNLVTNDKYDFLRNALKLISSPDDSPQSGAMLSVGGKPSSSRRRISNVLNKTQNMVNRKKKFTIKKKVKESKIN
jgi:hypothetical protein